MARPKEFDPEAALDRALELFWERGYEQVSMSDLVAGLGVARASIYATFGPKHELYLRALRRYLETRDPDPIALLSRPGPAMPAVRALVESYVAETLTDEHRRGCMLVNAAIERARFDAEAARVVRRSWDVLETALTGAIMRGQAQGEIGREHNPSALARFLVVVLQGIRVLARAEPDPDRVRDAGEQALVALR